MIRTPTELESLVLSAISEVHSSYSLGATVPEIQAMLRSMGLSTGLAEIAAATEQLLGTQTIMVHKLPNRQGWPVWKAREVDEDDVEDGESEEDDD